MNNIEREDGDYFRAAFEDTGPNALMRLRLLAGKLFARCFLKSRTISRQKEHIKALKDLVENQKKMIFCQKALIAELRKQSPLPPGDELPAESGGPVTVEYNGTDYRIG